MSGVFGQGSGGRSTRKGSSLRRRSTAVLVGSLIALTAAAGCSSSKAGGSGTGSAGEASATPSRSGRLPHRPR